MAERIKIFVIGLIGATLLRLINFTLRWERIGLDGDGKYWPYQKPRILSFWHGHQLFMSWIYTGGLRREKAPGMYALISQHRDGRIIAKAVEFLGIQSVEGSSTRRGLGALYELIETLNRGDHISITPDGPKGPCFEVKAGIIRIAQRTGAAIHPTAIAAKNKWTFKSWDRMFLPKPFSKAVMIMGDPIVIPSELPNDEAEKYRQLLEEKMNELNKFAEARVNSD